MTWELVWILVGVLVTHISVTMTKQHIGREVTQTKFKWPFVLIGLAIIVGTVGLT